MRRSLWKINFGKLGGKKRSEALREFHFYRGYPLDSNTTCRSNEVTWNQKLIVSK